MAESVSHSPDVPQKHCPSCLRLHSNRGRACSKWCERRIGGRAGWITRSRRESIDRVLAALQDRLRHRRRWREVAMGQHEPEHLLTIFGALPTDDPTLCDFGAE